MLSSISYPAILPWCFSLLLIHSFSTLSTASLIYTNETDRLALLAIKAQLRDPLGVTSSWNNSVPLCLWTGVSCGRRHQRVTKLDLISQSLEGRLSPSIGNLSFLRYTDLQNNSFYGEIPQEVGRLFRLETLMLLKNSFSGTIPTNLSQCSSLITFVASENDLEGEIPAEIGYLLKLKRLHIGVNHLVGQVPTSIGNLSVLQFINLRENSLGGGIPDTLGNVRDLTRFSLTSNKFTGMVPASIYNFSSLEYLYLSHNRLKGSLPSNIGFTLPRLKRFIFMGNNFIGSLPAESFSNASNLEYLGLGENNFRGKVSIDFNGLNKLSIIHLGENNLGTGTANDLEFLTSLQNCSKLEWLGLYENQFGGLLPHCIANLSTTMTRIVIGSNQIAGTIPPGIVNLVNLAMISMENNHISGTIPHDIGRLKNLQILYMYRNKLQGRIPNSLGNLTKLFDVELSENNLQGNIPSSLGNCQNLILLLLDNNKLNGIVPQQILGITTLSVGLDLSYNLLTGRFPLEIGNLKNLVLLNISKNMFSGEIPSTLGGCSSLEYLSMQGNSFTGRIPSSLSSLKSIKDLDLSSNGLSGQIPKYLENLPLLESLYLSYNELEGEVPTKGVFNSTTKISLTGNRRLCGGIAELHLPLCHSNGSKKSEIPLLRVVIPVIAAFLILSLAAFIVVVTRRRKFANNTSRMLHTDEQFPMVSYAELNKATDEFSPSNMIGQGRYGSVYKGILAENRMSVAVKVINLQQKGASTSFMAECEALRNIRHRNLVKIITLCSSIDFKMADFKALVYEYMQNGSLEEWLHQSENQVNMSNLSLIQRLNIAIDVSSAIEYLHHHSQPPIVHGDLKPSNVLLDHDMVAHVGDFGLAKFLSNNPLSTECGTQSSSIGIKGTIGYVAPEYGMGSQMSMPGDVYSFGIFLLEMFTGKRPTDRMFHDELNLHDFAKMSLPERVMQIAEPSLLLEVTTDNNNVENFARLHGEERVGMEECLVGALRIGVLCSMESPADRMEMTDVVAKLCAIKENFLSRRIRDVRPSSQLT